MNKLTIAAATSLLLLSACDKPGAIKQQDLVSGMQHYLETQGNLCLAKNSWPIDVTQQEIDRGGRNALQMPVLEKLGLVRWQTATVDVRDDERSATIQVKRYELTDAGKKFYVIKTPAGVTADGQSRPASVDFCAAKLSLDKIVKWEEVKADAGQKAAHITYTFKVDAAPWTHDADLQKVFPAVARIVNGAGSVELEETLKQTGQGWVAGEI